MAQETHTGAEKDPERQDSPQVVDSLEQEGSTCDLLTDSHRLCAYLRIITSTDDAAPDKQKLMDFLQERKVALGANVPQAVEQALARAAKAGTVGPFMIGQGRESEDGKDGSVEWLVRRPSELSLLPAKGARVDYKERNTFVNVRKGQRLLRVRQPTEGSPGLDVFGSQLPCRQGHPADIRKGKNVDFTDEGDFIIALASGYLEETANLISVEPVLTVKGDVDLSVGNIDFVGPVKINGDVLDGFTVKAEAEIEVNGTVEGARLESESFVAVRGGIAGKGKGRIICKGSLEAKYLNEVYVEAGGDVSVQNSIVSSTVKSRGRVDVVSGGIRGANVVARNGLHAPDIGSDMGVRTIVVVGVDYEAREKLAKLEHDLALAREAIDKMEGSLGPVLSNKHLLEQLPEDKAEVARKLLNQWKALTDQCTRLSGARDKILDEMQAGESVCIEVDKKIFPGVMIQIGTCRRSFEMEVGGPLKLFPDIERNSLKVKR
ncbi:MAG: DUF342 domain-containing protein [Planctomycetota bacterium]|jgi:uncharacterized protein (DUF342 family)